jgi:hypothetical protein
MIILTAKYTNNSGSTFWIRIYDREATEEKTTEFDCGPEFFSLKSEGSRTDTFKRIIPKTLQFKVLTGCYDYTTTQNTEIAAFYEALTTSFEGRFFVTVTRGGDMLFRGKILPDVGDFLMNEIGDFVITAIDGITDLQNREYRPTDYSDLVPESAIKTYTFNEHFIEMIRRIDTVEYFAELLAGSSIGISLLATANNWTAENPDHATLGNSVAGDIFEQVMVRNYWFEKKSDSYRKYQSCWDALTDILTGFNAVMYYDQGRYYVEQRSIQDNAPGSITYYHYFQDASGNIITGSGLTKVQHNYNTNDNLWSGVGKRKGRLPAFKAIELEQGKQFTNYINGLLVKMQSSGTGFTYNYGPVIGAGYKVVTQLLCKMNLGGGWSLSMTHTEFSYLEFNMRFKIKIGDYYLSADNFAGGIIEVVPDGNFHVLVNALDVPVCNWTLVNSTITVRWKKLIQAQNIGTFWNQLQAYINTIALTDLVLESNEIQEDGNFLVEFIDFVAKKNNVAIDGFPAGNITLSKNSRIIISNGYNDLYEKPKGIKRYEIGDTRNSEVYTAKLGYYDSELAVTNQLFIKTPDGTPIWEYYPSVSWNDPDPNITLPIEELMMKSMLAMRAKPALVYMLDLYYKNNTMLNFGDQVVMYDAVCVPIDMEMIAAGPGGYTTWRTVLWEIEKDYDGINIVDTGEPEVEPIPYPIPDGTLDLFSPSQPTGVEYWEEWENVSTAYVTPVAGEDYSVMVNLLEDYIPSVKKKWQFYINGVKQAYKPTGTLALGQWRFDLDNNRIVYIKGSTNVRHIEVIKYF